MTIFLLVLAIPLIIVVLIYAAIYIYLRPLFHKPEPLPYDNIEDFGLRPAHLFEGPSVHSKLIDAILSIYKQDGLRFSFFEIIFKSKHYPLAAMWKDFIHEPDLRWALILCGIPNLIAQDRGALGFSLPMPRSRLFNIQYYTQYDIGLVVSELIHGLEIGHADGVSWRSSLILFIETAVGSLVKEAVHYPGTDTVVHRYCNDPQIAHPDVNAILMRHYFHWPDHDSTSIIMAALQKYLQYSDKHPQEFDAGLREDVRSLLKNPGLLDLLDNSYGPVNEYLFPAAKQWLDDNCVHYAFNTWFDGATNDIDPTTNMDIIANLVRNRHGFGVLDRTETLRQIHGALHYLEFLAKNGGLFSPDIHQYYPQTMMLFLWRRLTEAFSELTQDEMRRLDPMGRITRIERVIKDYWSETFFRDPKPRQIHPINLLLIGRAFPDRIGELKEMAASWYSGARSPVTAELFRMLYPTGVIWGNAMFIFALAFALPIGIRQKTKT